MKEEAKKSLDFFKQFAKKSQVQTTQGIVYTHPLVSGRWSSISSSDDAATMGKAALRALTGPEEEAGDETVLSDDVFERLSPDDIQKLASAIAQANQLGDLPERQPPAEGLGVLIRKIQAAHLEQTKRLMERVSSSPFFPGLEKSTARRLQEQLDAMEASHTAFKQFKSPEPAILTHRYIPDPDTTPMGRAAIASELTAKHVANVADQTADLVLKMSELTETLIRNALPEWRQNLEAEKKASAESNAQAVENLAVATKSLQTAQRTLRVTVGIAIATMVVQIGQYLWSERGAAEERAKQAETEKLRHEATLQVFREQLSAQQQLLSTQPHTPLPKNKESESRK